eukprot:scaffold1136_cov146-Cylindrotheca_fusiformis.AAC.10
MTIHLYFLYYNLKGWGDRMHSIGLTPALLSAVVDLECCKRIRSKHIVTAEKTGCSNVRQISCVTQGSAASLPSAVSAEWSH